MTEPRRTQTGESAKSEEKHNESLSEYEESAHEKPMKKSFAGKKDSAELLGANLRASAPELPLKNQGVQSKKMLEGQTYHHYHTEGPSTQEEQSTHVFEKELASNNLTLKTILKGNQEGEAGLTTKPRPKMQQQKQQPLKQQHPPSKQQQLPQQPQQPLAINRVDREKIRFLASGQGREHPIRPATSPDLKSSFRMLSPSGNRIPTLQAHKPWSPEPQPKTSKKIPRMLSPNYKNTTKPATTKKQFSPRDTGFRTGKALEQNYKKEQHNNIEPPREHPEFVSSSINVYFYKNFNKYIQNLYIKEEQNAKQNAQASKSKKDKYAPYKSESSLRKPNVVEKKSFVKPDQSDNSVRSIIENIKGKIDSSSSLKKEKLATSNELIREINNLILNPPGFEGGHQRKKPKNARNIAQESKVLLKSTSLTHFENQELKKYSIPDSSNKQQIFSPRVGKY